MKNSTPIKDPYIKDAIEDCTPKARSDHLQVDEIRCYLSKIQDVEASYLGDWLDNENRVLTKETDDAYYFSLHISDTFWIDTWEWLEINDDTLKEAAHQAHARQAWTDTNSDWENRYAFVLAKP